MGLVPESSWREKEGGLCAHIGVRAGVFEKVTFAGSPEGLKGASPSVA